MHSTVNCPVYLLIFNIPMLSSRCSSEQTLLSEGTNGHPSLHRHSCGFPSHCKYFANNYYKGLFMPCVLPSYWVCHIAGACVFNNPVLAGAPVLGTRTQVPPPTSPPVSCGKKLSRLQKTLACNCYFRLSEMLEVT